MRKLLYLINVFLLSVILISSLYRLYHPSVRADPTVVFYIDPPSTLVDLEEFFSVNACIVDVTDLAGWEFKLYFRNNIVTWLATTEGPFLKQGGSTSFFIIEFNNNYNETHGRVWATCVLLGGVPGVTGSGTLATISFSADEGGSSTLHLADTVIGNSTAHSIPHTTVDGSVQASPPVTITDITAFAPIAAQGFLFPINVTTQNDGETPANFNLTTYYNMTEIETQTITQPNETSLATTSIWNTTGIERYQNYTISATTGSNTSTDGTITIVYPGDVDADRDVDIFDIVKITSAYGSQRGDPLYVSVGDINCSNNIDIFDVVIAAGNYGYEE